MIPIRDENPTRTSPVVVWVFIAINVAVFLFQVSLGPAGMQAFVQDWGVVPDRLLAGRAPEDLLTPLTSMFMHGGWLHIIGNMWFLYVFGDNVEDSLGRGRFVLFYLMCGLAAVVAQVAIDPGSRVPMVGASGAIAGVLAGYVRLHPRAEVLTVVPIFIFLQFIYLPAFVFIFVWFGFQLLSGVVSLGQIGQQTGGVAFFAHIGGFVAGYLLIPVFRGGRSGRRPRNAETIWGRTSQGGGWGRDPRGGWRN
ncbi:MAG TPA: rhomboid family intramembrane serine protease [Polyangiaceae bacterium LLY-WYZ-14_1]|nr:rhomboid family intramembrane serine protease [Polyangiaceae bacterium LLY-WYZ-14_1]